MYAIVEIAGQQFKVEKDRKVYVHRLAAEEGAQIEFDSVLLVDNDGQVKIGTPKVEGAKVTAKVLSHLKGEKERSPSISDSDSNRIYQRLSSVE